MTDASNKHFLKRVQKTVGRAINRYGMIQAGDRIVVGISGGKDSAVLLETLSLRRRWIPIHYELIAVHIHVEGITPLIELDSYQELCSQMGIPFHFRTIAIDRNRDPDKSICFVCSWHRRKELFLTAKELGCRRLALGHHMDDAIETLFMNMAFHATISSMPPRLSMFGGELEIIRPLILLTEQEVERYARIRGFPLSKTQCPYGDQSRRDEIKSLIKALCRGNRRTKMNLYASMSHINREYLPSE